MEQVQHVATFWLLFSTPCNRFVHECPNSNVQDYPEHRLNFFALLRVIINEVPSTLFQLAPHQLKVVIDAILWAIRHKERNIAELGLNTMLEMLSIVDKNEVATQFYQHFHGQFVSEIFHVMTGENLLFLILHTELVSPTLSPERPTDLLGTFGTICLKCLLSLNVSMAERNLRCSIIVRFQAVNSDTHQSRPM